MPPLCLGRTSQLRAESQNPRPVPAKDVGTRTGQPISVGAAPSFSRFLRESGEFDLLSGIPIPGKPSGNISSMLPLRLSRRHTMVCICLGVSGDFRKRGVCTFSGLVATGVRHVWARRRLATSSHELPERTLERARQWYGEEPPALLSTGSMSPPGYPSGWLHPCSARFRFTRQVDFSSAAPCCSQLPS